MVEWEHTLELYAVWIAVAVGAANGVDRGLCLASHQSHEFSTQPQTRDFWHSRLLGHCVYSFLY